MRRSFNKTLAMSALAAGILLLPGVYAQEDGARNPVLEPRILDRYVEALRRNPFQDRAFDSVFSSYFASDGIEAWVARLEHADEAPETAAADLILLGRIRARLFQPEEAIAYLEQVEGSAADNPELQELLGTLYANTGQFEISAERLAAALDGLDNPDTRADVARRLGDVLIRLGRVDEAAQTFGRIAEDGSDVFALQALAEIYENHEQWDEAIATRRRIIEASADNAYRQCQALRAIGDIQVRQDAFADAAASYERALTLVSPGNWLYANLKDRLIATYEAWDNLAGLADYLIARIESDAADVELRVLLAETMQRLGRVDDAAATLKDALDRAPAHVRAHEALADLYAAANRNDDLRDTLVTMVERFPTTQEYRRRLGEAHFNAGDTEKAVEVWRGVISPGADAATYATLARWFERYELIAEGIDALKTAIDLEDSRELRMRLADLQFQSGDAEGAVETWTSILDGTDTTSADYVEIAMLLAARELLDDAESLLLRAIELEPSSGQPKLSLGKLLVRRGRFEASIPYFSDLADQSEHTYLQDRGIDGLLDAYSSLGQLQTQKDEWERAASADPDSLPILARLAKMEMRLGNKRRVVDIYELCVEIAPDEASYRLALARAYRTNEQPLEAIAAYKHLIQQDASRAAGYYRELASLCVEENQTEEAVMVAQAIVRRAPADHSALRGLARAYASDGQRDNAIESFRKALQLKPGDPDLLREYGDLLADYGQFGLAQETYRRMLSSAPHERGRLDAVRLLGSLYKTYGHEDELIREFQTRSERMPEDAAAREELAAVYSATGDGERAVETLEDALRFAANEEEALRKVLRAAYEANDLRKVVAVHHQLESLQGELSPRERERLGAAYARLGAYREAVAAWDVLYEQRPGDPKILASLARTMREEGFSNRALQVSARAVSLDPYNYALRYGYAVRLAVADRLTDAIDQMKTILELEDEITGADEGGTPFSTNSNASVMGQQRQGLSKKPPLALLEDLGRDWQGSFSDFRRIVIFGIVQIAREMNTAHSHIEEFRIAAEANPKSARAKEDLLIAYQAGERWGAALTIANALANEQPDNLWLLREIGLMTQRSKRIDAAIKRQEQHAKTYPESWVANSLSVLPLLYQQGHTARAEAIVERLWKEHGDSTRILHPLASVVRGFGSVDDVVRLYKRLIELDANDRGGIRLKLARLYEHRGEVDAARAMYEQLVFEPRPSVARTGQLEVRANRFMPHGYFGVAELIGRFRWDVDVERMKAFDALVILEGNDSQPGATVDRVNGLIENIGQSLKPESTRLASDLGKLVIAHHVQHDRFADAHALLNRMLETGFRDSDLTTFRFFEERGPTPSTLGS